VNCLLPFRELLLLTLAPWIVIVASHSTHFCTTVHEDNAGALELANMEPGQITPRSKRYLVKMHWFQSKHDPNGSHPITIIIIIIIITSFLFIQTVMALCL
jgi:hypothetical protein